MISARFITLYIFVKGYLTGTMSSQDYKIKVARAKALAALAAAKLQRQIEYEKEALREFDAIADERDNLEVPPPPPLEFKGVYKHREICLRRGRCRCWTE